MTNGIENNGCKIITIDMGNINCMNEPMIINLNGIDIIMRYKCSARDDDYGKLTLEATAK